MSLTHDYVNMLYNMLSICEISPLYQAIWNFGTQTAPSGAGDANLEQSSQDFLILNPLEKLNLFN